MSNSHGTIMDNAEEGSTLVQNSGGEWRSKL